MREVDIKICDRWNKILRSCDISLNYNYRGNISFCRYDGQQLPASLSMYTKLDVIPISSSKEIRMPEYRFTFLMPKRNIEIFKYVLNKRLNTGFRIGDDYEYLYKDDVKDLDIVTDDINEVIDDVEYSKLSINLTGKNLIKSIFYLTSIEDTILILNESYDMKSEKPKPKTEFQVGDVVCYKGKTFDYIIYEIEWFVNEGILSHAYRITKKSDGDIIVIEDDTIEYAESLVISRGHRIESIIN